MESALLRNVVSYQQEFRLAHEGKSDVLNSSAFLCLDKHADRISGISTRCEGMSKWPLLLEDSNILT